MTRPNIIWICTDQQRSDSLGCYGNSIARTPNIDSIASTGIRFNRHITPMQICSPSRATMFTGLYPRHHKLITNGMALPDDIPTLTSILAQTGYHTHSVGKQHLQPLLAPSGKRMPDSRAFWARPESKTWNGPYYGFQTLDLLLGEADTAAEAGHYANWLLEHFPDSAELLNSENALEPPPKDLDEIWRSPIHADHHYNTWITDCAIKFIEQKSSPFFLFISYPDPHHPFSPPVSYADRYDPAMMPLPEQINEKEKASLPSYYGELYPKGEGFRELYWAAREDMEAGSLMTTEHISEASLQKAIAYTYAMIEMIDDGVGRILKTLGTLNLKDDTIIMFTSDHGELLGTHGLLHKGPPSYRQLTEVSMLMSGPGVPANNVTNELTSHVDLTPTFLDIAGVPYDSVDFDGLSIAGVIKGKTSNLPRNFSFGEYHPTARKELYNQTIYSGQWRLTIYPHRQDWGEMFDHQSDPEECCNRYFDPACLKVRESLKHILSEHFPPKTEVDNEWICRW